MQSWINKSCEDDAWPPEIITGPQTASLMTEAAAAVFDAIVDAEKNAVRGVFG